MTNELNVTLISKHVSDLGRQVNCKTSIFLKAVIEPLGVKKDAFGD